MLNLNHAFDGPTPMPFERAFDGPVILPFEPALDGPNPHPFHACIEAIDAIIDSAQIAVEVQAGETARVIDRDDFGWAGYTPHPDDFGGSSPVLGPDDLGPCTAVSCPVGQPNPWFVELAAEAQVGFAMHDLTILADVFEFVGIEDDDAIFVTFDPANEVAGAFVAELGGVRANGPEGKADAFLFHAAEKIGFEIAVLDAEIVAERAVDLAEAGATLMIDTSHVDLGDGSGEGEPHLTGFGFLEG